MIPQLFPFRFGGGTNRYQAAYNLLTRALGVGGTAKDPRGIDGLWRRSLAKGLAAAASFVPSAALQAFEKNAQDNIPSLERELGINPDPDANPEQRRQAIMRAEYQEWSALLPELAALLTEIDPRLSIITVDPELSVTTVHGRAFGAPTANAESPTWIGQSMVPNYSTSFVLHVLFLTGHGGALTKAEEATRANAVRRVRARLPSWVDLEIVTSITGFVLGDSVLGDDALVEE